MKRTAVILLTSIICLAAGTVIVYYNTSSLGYDDTNLFSVNGEVITVMDIDINYKRIKQSIDKVRKNIIYKPITI